MTTSTRTADEATSHGDAVHFIVDQLQDRRCALVPAKLTHALIGPSASDFQDFARQWDDLVTDTYMADGGTYRKRRYGRFQLDAAKGELVLQPHGPYRQEATVNYLNGGLDRKFEPLTADFAGHSVLVNLLQGLGEAYSEVEGHSLWDIKLHPYRILASRDQVGQPAPEGRHRDGVTYILTLMIQRQNIEGGKSSAYTEEGEPLVAHTLAEQGEMLLGDDRVTLHAVTPVTPSSDAGGHRDVLVVAFTARTEDEVAEPAISAHA